MGNITKQLEWLEEAARCYRNEHNSFQDMQQTDAFVKEISSVVSLFSQIKWERDMAVSQLHNLGTELGEEPQLARKRIKEEAVQEFVNKAIDMISSNAYLVTQKYNSVEPGMTVIGIQQALEETLEEMFVEVKVSEITDEQLKDWLREQVSDLTDGKMYQTVRPASHSNKLSPQTVFEIFHSYISPGSGERKKFSNFSDCLYHRVCYGKLQSAVDAAENWLQDQIKQRLEKQSPEFRGTMSRRVGDGFELADLGGYEGTRIDLEAFVDTPYRMNLIFATEREREYPDSIARQYSVDPDRFPLRDFDSYEKVSDNALTYLIHQQGHTVSEVCDSLHKSIGNGFVYSVAVELEESGATIQELTALVTLSGKQLLSVLDAIASGEGNLRIGVASVIGLFDKRSGRGSELDINLEKDAIFPASMVSDLQIEGADPSGLEHRYTVGGSYELNGRFWERGGVAVTDEQPQLREEDMAKTLEKLWDYLEPNKDMPER